MDVETVLVTGGTGLVGSRLLRRFVDAGVQCRAIVRAGRSAPEGVEAVEGDLFDQSSLARALEGVTAVVHLAASFRSGNDDETWHVNLNGTRSLLAAVRDTAPEARFLMASTSNVYDADGARPAHEDDELHPAQAYPASKVQAERLVRDSGLTWAILRLPFVYGEGDGHLDAVPRLLSSMGWHPAQRMSTAHHRDVAAAFLLALEGVMDGRTVNIADDAALTVYEIASLAGGEFPTSATAVTDPWRGVVDTSLARSLGYRPRVRTIRQAAEEGAL